MGTLEYPRFLISTNSIICKLVNFACLTMPDGFSLKIGSNIFYLHTLYIEQHIKTYNNIQYTNGIQKKVFRLIQICIPFKISILLILSRFREKTISVPMLILVLKCTSRVWKLFN